MGKIIEFKQPEEEYYAEIKCSVTSDGKQPHIEFKASDPDTLLCLIANLIIVALKETGANAEDYFEITKKAVMEILNEK